MIGYAFEARDEYGRWTMDAAGVQDESNYLPTREDAEAELPLLAEALGCDVDDLRVVEVETKRGCGYYAVDTGDGNELCSGLAPEIAHQAAQRHADHLGESVYLYEVGSKDEAEEIEPS